MTGLVLASCTMIMYASNSLYDTHSMFYNLFSSSQPRTIAYNKTMVITYSTISKVLIMA